MINKFKQKIMYTLRGRLSLWYISTTIIIFSLFSLLIGILFWVTIQSQVDHHIRIVVNEAKDIVSQYTGKERDDLIKNLVSAQGMTVVVLSPDGAPVLETNSPDTSAVTEHQLQRIIALRANNNDTPIHFTQENVRFAATSIQFRSGNGVVAVGYSTKIFTETYYRLFIIIILSIILLVLPTTYVGYILLKKQLTPLEKIAQETKYIVDTSSLYKRIMVDTSIKELGTIQKAFNSMISRLEDIFLNERDFFLDAAHTLKTPLAVLRSQIETTKLKSKKQDELLQTIDHANDIIQDLLYLTKIGNINTQHSRVSVRNIVLDLSELATTLGEEKDLHISTHIQEGVFINGNKNLLLRALSNIVINAVSYNQNGGNIAISLIENKKVTTIAVKDTGIGIPKTEIKKVFSRFFRGSNATSGGSGLGLPITKAVIESHGGKISINSKLNKGTIIKITFS